MGWDMGLSETNISVKLIDPKSKWLGLDLSIQHILLINVCYLTYQYETT